MRDNKKIKNLAMKSNTELMDLFTAPATMGKNREMVAKELTKRKVSFT